MPRERKGSVKNKNSNINNCGNDGNDNEIMTTKTTNKKRRTSNANNNSNNNNNQSNSNNNNNLNNNNSNNANNKGLELIPPQPISTFGDTIIASNPFDDTPQSSQQPTAQSQQTTAQPQNQSPNNMLNNGSNGSMGPIGGQPQSMQSQTGGQPPKPVPLMSGKIYPPEQSMVFNPANPNAPPIYPCGICHKEVHDNDQAILCESGCNFWFHRICTGISERAYFLLTQEVYAEWVCDKCTNNKTIPLVKFKP